MSGPYGPRPRDAQPHPVHPPIQPPTHPPVGYGGFSQSGEEQQFSGRPIQRPALLTLSLVMIITGSMLLMTELALVWLFVSIARDGLGYSGTDGIFYHMLERFHLQMLKGLAWVGFGFPGAAVVLSFFLLLRRPWPRIAVSLLGAATIVAAAVVLSGHIAWVVPIGVYIAFAVAILWTPDVTIWCRGGDSADRTR
ncbi:hypothetical protein [Microlunatus sp. Gsoil 973]|uniref:hypothetical protein n=1 Tax=Microlunatus sp. Gsoil 973 TaxID=2672569 RepID=UPI0012B4FDF2|nr:hypothetical protein [Microlunatus sp. Gsoil 973]QGN34747.1 hypothetical protein GJV80_20100 [Microlunatus sp. Gsoil 973]